VTTACPPSALQTPLSRLPGDYAPASQQARRKARIGIPDTNAIEALNSKLRRAVRARGHFPTDEAALKLLFLVLNRSEKEWTMPARE
jgi:hypothetical protein